MPMTDTLTTPPQSPAGSEKGFKQRKSKTSKRSTKELHEICSKIHDPTMNQLKDLLPDMLDAVYSPHDNRLKRQNKWQSKPAGYPDDIPLHSPGNYIPNEKRKPRKTDLMPQYTHLREKIAEKVASMSEEVEVIYSREGVEKDEPDSYHGYKLSLPLTSKMLSSVQEDTTPPSLVQQQRQLTMQETSPDTQGGDNYVLLTSLSGSTFSYPHVEEMETENYNVSSQPTTASQIGYDEQDLTLDHICEGVIEMEEKWGMTNPAMYISGMEYQPPRDPLTTSCPDLLTSSCPDPAPAPAVIPTTVMQYSQNQGQGDLSSVFEILDTGQGATSSAVDVQEDMDMEIPYDDNFDILSSAVETSDILSDMNFE